MSSWRDKEKVYLYSRVCWQQPYLPTHFRPVETMQPKCAKLRVLEITWLLVN